MTDRELLELAAKASGLVMLDTLPNMPFWANAHEGLMGPWNPLEDDADALRLAVSLCMNLEITETDVYACCRGNFSEPAKPDSCASMRRAIVRAAAEIGRSMP